MLEILPHQIPYIIMIVNDDYMCGLVHCPNLRAVNLKLSSADIWPAFLASSS
jgi:hypothetical protein